MSTPKLDPSKLTEEQRDKLDKWTQGKQTLQALDDLTSMVQDIVMTMDSNVKKDKKTVDSIGALLMDMRDSLSTLKDKEDPELPDYAKPITDAFRKLEKAVKSIDVKPNVKVDAPQVNVDTPSVNVDLKGVEKLLKTDIPKAFKESMKLVPKPDKFDPKPLLDAYKELGIKLDDIDKGVRMKQSGVNAKISNFSDLIVQTDALTDTELRASAIEVDGSGVTQPVSGTVTANLSASDNQVLDNIQSAVDGINAKDLALGTDISAVFGVNTLLTTTQADSRVNTTDGLTVNAWGQYYNGSTWDRMRGDATDGLLVNLGSNNDVTVTGTVTANLSATDNTVLDNIDSNTAPTTGLNTGRKVVTTAGTAVAIASSTTCKWVAITAETDNTGYIVVGDSGVIASLSTREGVPLNAGDSIVIPIDNLSDVYIDSTVSGEGVTFTYGT